MNFLDMNFIYKRENEKLSSIETLFNKINLEYDANNIINKRVYPNALEENICYDENYNIVSIKTANKTLDYKYNAIGQVIKKNDDKFEYDNLNRLIKTPNEEFTYDLVGNELSNNSIYDLKQYNLLKDDIYTLSYD